MAGQAVGKIALITGAGSGIGRATALAFAREGAKLVISDINAETGEKTLELVKSSGAEGLFVKADVSKEEDVKALIAKTIATYKRLDCAFNNAGIEGIVGTTVDCTRENWDTVIAVNLTGVWLCMKEEIPHMVKQGGGAIVNASSAAGLVGSPGMPAYVASKHGVVGLTKTAALECATSNVRVNAVCPALIDTPMAERLLKDRPKIADRLLALQPTGRMGKPEEVAEAVTWLCSDGASYVTGTAIPVDGGDVAH